MLERKGNGSETGKGYRYALTLVLTVFCCCGCARRETDADNLIITEKEAEGIQYSMTEAVLGDVVLTEQVKCTYLQTREQEIRFSVSGRQIARIPVRAGDSVEKGQLVAELAGDWSDGRAEELEYQIQRNSLLLEQLRVNEDYEISAKWLQYLYRSGKTEQEEKDLKESIRKLQQRNQYLREDYQDAIDLDRMELASLQEADTASRLYAGMSGTVSWIKQDLEGSTCSRDEVIMRIIDASECLFVVEGADYAELFREDAPVELSISSGVGAGRYRLLPYEMEKWGEELTFSLTEEYENSVIEVGTTGIIRVILDRRENVLTLPAGAVHTADGRAYVYVAGEGGTREVRWIETGLYGDDSVEIEEGLEQGEKVILK